MRIICTYILLLALTLQSFYRSVMTMEYQLHLPDYIAQCINKEKPQLHCNGQCVLMKKIQEKEKEETQKNLVVYEYSSLYVHKEKLTLPSQKLLEMKEAHHGTPYLNSYRFDTYSSIFIPPIA